MTALDPVESPTITRLFYSTNSRMGIFFKYFKYAVGGANAAPLVISMAEV